MAVHAAMPGRRNAQAVVLTRLPTIWPRAFTDGAGWLGAAEVLPS